MEAVIIIFIFAFIIISAAKAGKNKNKKPFKKYKHKNYKINNINSNKGNLYNTININSETYQNATDIAKYFNISAIELNDIFKTLGWAYKQDRWWIATDLGIRKGAKQEYDKKSKLKFIKWNTKIKNDIEIINAVQDIKNMKYMKNKEENKTKKEKGDQYEAYISDFFKKQGYYVWEHGKEKGVKDSSIDLFVKKENYIYFVQCKDWKKWKIDHKEVKATRTDIREYLQKNKDFFNIIKNYEQKILYVTSKECLTAGAYKYIEENKDILEYQVIPIEA